MDQFNSIPHNLDSNKKIDVLIEIERLCEHILIIKNKNIQNDLKRKRNKELMEKFFQGQVQKDNKLWFSYNDFFLKLDRKTVVELIEKENAGIIKEVQTNNATLKDLCKTIFNHEKDVTKLNEEVVSIFKEYYCKEINMYNKANNIYNQEFEEVD